MVSEQKPIEKIDQVESSFQERPDKKIIITNVFVYKKRPNNLPGEIFDYKIPVKIRTYFAALADLRDKYKRQYGKDKIIVFEHMDVPPPHPTAFKSKEKNDDQG